MVEFSRIKSLWGMQKVLWLIYRHSQNPLKLRQVARHHLMRMPNVWHKSAWKPAEKLGVEVRAVGRALGRRHFHTHNLFLMSAFCREADEKSLPLDSGNSGCRSLDAPNWGSCVLIGIYFSYRSNLWVRSVSFWESTKKGAEVIAILCFIIC